MFDVFYLGIKPNLFPHERKADSIEHAQALSRTRCCWIVDYLTDYSTFDFLWEPAPWQSQYTHVWPSKWESYYSTYLVPKITKTVEYHVHNQVLPPRLIKENYKFLVDADFDISWTPHPWDPPYNYVFGNQHYTAEVMPTVKYTMPGATEEKYVDNVVATLKPSSLHWETLEPIDQDSWDWSWVPDPGEPPYIYVFGNQWNPPEFKASVRYHVPGATEYKYMEKRTRRLPQKHLFDFNIAVGQFDYSWEPNPFDPPYIYVFGNTWNPAEIEPSVTYTVPGATEIKYVHDIVAKPWSSLADWEFMDNIDEGSFDWTWRPNPKDPPYIYLFGSNWHPAEVKPVLCYAVNGATDVKYMDAPRAKRMPTPDKFTLLYACDFDFTWEPDPGSPPYNYVFGNQWHAAEIMPTVEYRMEGATSKKYVDYPRATLKERHDNHWHTIIDCNWDYSWVPDPGDPPYIYVFGNQHWSAEKMPTVEYHVVGATERKFMDGPRAELLPDRTHWTLPAGVNEETVDFSWVPDPGEPPYIYQFATQHQKTGGPVYTVPGAVETKYLEHVQIKIETATAPVIEIDHMDGNAGQIPGTVKRVRYFDNYRDTLIRLAKSLKGEHEFVWVCSSNCDYTYFDFSWHPEQWQTTMLHVFASNDQKFGDTFFMHVPTFAERAEKKELLEWYSVNYVPRKSVPRRPIPVIEHNNDTHVEQVKNATWVGPLAVFTDGAFDFDLPAVNLWRANTKAIVPLNHSASTVIVPQAAVPYIKTQLYDYSIIDKTYRSKQDRSMDVIFISYDEPDADKNWNELKNKTPRAKRVHGVSGMELALEAAADISSTPWYYAVFAKTKIHENFDFSFVPDYMQQSKHYIFDCLNTVNQLQYGHMGIVMYNCQGIKKLNQQKNFGLDYTLSFPHESIPVLSCYGNFDQSPYHTWRTAFREAAKLAYFESESPSVDGAYRLSVWQSQASGQYAEWCLNGAHDGVEFFNASKKELSVLKQSFEWRWLRNYFVSKYGELE